MKNLLTLIRVIFLIAILNSCGGSGSNEETSPILKKGKLSIPITGLRYTTSSNVEGITQSGEFKFNDNDVITFFLNNLKVKSLTANTNIPLESLFSLQTFSQIELLDAMQLNNYRPREKSLKLNNLKAYKNFLSKLYHLDEDDNLNNGIQIPTNLLLDAPNINYFLKQPNNYILASNDKEIPIQKDLEVINDYISNNFLEINRFRQTELTKTPNSTYSKEDKHHITYDYDSSDRLINVINHNLISNEIKTIEYRYSDNQLIKKIDGIIGKTTIYSYHEDGSSQETIYHNSSVSRISYYDIYGNLIENGDYVTEIINGQRGRTWLIKDGVRELVEERAYRNGLVTKLMFYRDGASHVEYNYDYNTYGQLIYESTKNSDPIVGDFENTYVYNENSLLSKISLTTTQDENSYHSEKTYKYNDNNQLIKISTLNHDNSTLDRIPFVWELDKISQYQYVSYWPRQDVQNFYNDNGLIEETLYVFPSEGQTFQLGSYESKYQSSEKLHSLPSLYSERQNACELSPLMVGKCPTGEQ